MGCSCPESKHRIIAIAVNPAKAKGGVGGCMEWNGAGFCGDGGDGARWARAGGGSER